MEEKNIKEPTPEGEKLRAVELAEDELSYITGAIWEDAGSNQQFLPFYKRLLKKLVDEEEYKKYLSCGRFEEDEEESEILA